MPLQRFEGRGALVTGAASGIGRATALRLSGEGATVVAVDVNADLLATMSEEAGATGGSLSTLVADVGSEAGVDLLVAEAIDRLGKLDVVVNAAGVLSFSHTHEETLDEWSRLITINLTGTFLVCRRALPHLVSSGGNIVNLASTAAHAGQPWAAAYAASKGGVLAFTRALAVEYAGAGVRANTISPGAIDTPITQAFHLPEGADSKLIHRVTPIGGFGTPEGIAAAIAYVASDEASHMNGADILIDGATLA
jgi:meso-butanediol dehydrogenase/(S,S)-butanediol dehydrogenase/diacetyl reductase